MKDLKKLKLTELTQEEKSILTEVQMSKIVGGTEQVGCDSNSGSYSINCKCTADPVHGVGSES